MTDVALRALEREARQGDPAVQARLLHDRVRAGDLPPEDLELAARLGHPIAISATGPLAPGTAWLPLGDVSRGWWGMLRLLGQLAQRRPLAVAEWLVWASEPKALEDHLGRFREPTRFGLAMLSLKTWIQNPRRLETRTPDLLLTISPDRGSFLALCLRGFQEREGGKLNKEGCEVVVAQRLRLAELVLRSREEPLPKRRRRQSDLEKALLDSASRVPPFVAPAASLQRQGRALRPRREPIHETSTLQCANCNVSGTTLGGMHALMHWHPDPSLVLCDACHWQRAADTRGATP